MSVRRTTAPRKRVVPAPNAATSTALVEPIAKGEESDQTDSGRDLTESKAELLRDFNTGLQEQRDTLGIAPEVLQELSEHFESALMQLTGEQAAASLTADELKVTLLDSVRAPTAGMDAQEAGELVRHLEAATEKLELRETKIAFEFNRRIKSDGKAQAIAWLQEQLAATSPEDAESVAHYLEDHARAISGTDTVNSRSRRLRGPPKTL